MSQAVRNALRQKLEAEDQANKAATQRLLESYRDAAEGADTGPVEAHLRALLDQVRLVRPRLAESLRATIYLLVEVNSWPAGTCDMNTASGNVCQGTRSPR